MVITKIDGNNEIFCVTTNSDFKRIKKTECSLKIDKFELADVTIFLLKLAELRTLFYEYL